MAKPFTGSQHIWPRVLLSPMAKTGHIYNQLIIEKKELIMMKRKKKI